MVQKYTAAVIGCGKIGVLMDMDPKRLRPATHAGAYSGSSLAHLGALVDSNPQQLEKAAKIYPDAQTFDSVEKMLENFVPDLVSVATPPPDHRTSVEACARSKVKAIICEKPIAPAIRDAEAMVDACARSGSLLFVNHTRRFDPVMQNSAKMVRENGLGKLRQVSGYYTAGLMNTGTHLVDLIRFFTGTDFSEVRAFHDDRFSHPNGDVNVNALAALKNGCMVTLQVLDVKDYAIFDLHLYGSEGCLRIERFGFTTRMLPVINCADFDGYKELDQLTTTSAGVSRSFFAEMVSHVVDCINGVSRPVSSGEDGLAALKVLLAMKESSDSGGTPIKL